MKYDTLCTSDNFLYPVKIEPQKICLADIHSIAKGYYFRFPNFYFYEKEHIISGWLLITGNIILKVFHSRQHVWRLLILLKRIERGLGISLIKRRIYELKMSLSDNINRKKNGFSLISILHKTT